MAVGLLGRAVVASFAGAALGGRLVAAFGVVVGEPSGATVGRVGEDRAHRRGGLSMVSAAGQRRRLSAAARRAGALALREGAGVGCRAACL
jgi:hypothetical protein